MIVTQRIDYFPTKVHRARCITAPRSGPPITTSQSISGAEADAAVRVVDVRTRAAEPCTLLVVRGAADACSRLLLVKLQNTHLKLYLLVTVGGSPSAGGSPNWGEQGRSSRDVQEV